MLRQRHKKSAYRFKTVREIFYAVIFVGALRFGGLPLFIGELYSAVAAEGFNTSVVGSLCLLGKEATGNSFVRVSVVFHAITAFSVMRAVKGARTGSRCTFAVVVFVFVDISHGASPFVDMFTIHYNRTKVKRGSDISSNLRISGREQMRYIAVLRSRLRQEHRYPKERLYQHRRRRL